MPRVCSHRAHSGFLCAASRRLLHRHLLFENVSPIADETFPSARGESITLWKQKQKQGAVCAKLRTNYTLSFTIWPVNLALAASATSGVLNSFLRAGAAGDQRVLPNEVDVCGQPTRLHI